MLSNLIPSSDVHQLFRPTTPDIKYTTFKSFDTEYLLGKGGQNPINAGSSMFNAGSDPKMEPYVNQFIISSFNGNNYLLKYVDKHKLSHLGAMNLIAFKKDKSFRNIVLNKILDRNTYQLKDKIYPGYLFIMLTLDFMLKRSFYKQNDKRGIAEMNKYFTNESDFLKKQIDCLFDADEIENLTSFCSGRFFFVDDKFTDWKDFKQLALRSSELLIIKG